jgi:hypothetical protein
MSTERRLRENERAHEVTEPVAVSFRRNARYASTQKQALDAKLHLLLASPEGCEDVYDAEVVDAGLVHRRDADEVWVVLVLSSSHLNVDRRCIRPLIILSIDAYQKGVIDYRVPF